MHVEPLELRRHLSVDLVNGLLRVNGTANADSITVTLHNHEFRITLNGASKTFKASKVHELKVRGFAGGDNVQLFGLINIPIAVFGERGNDTIHGSDGRDLLDGGGGNDSIDGGLNDDWLIGGSGKDRLVDHNGDDVFFGGSGRDILNSRDGHGGDELHTGPGVDRPFHDKGDAVNPKRVENVPPADFPFFDDVSVDLSMPADSGSGDDPTTQPTTQPTDDPGSDSDPDSDLDFDWDEDFEDF